MFTTVGVCPSPSRVFPFNLTKIKPVLLSWSQPHVINNFFYNPLRILELNFCC